MMLGDKLHIKNNENTCFLVESRQVRFYTHALKVYINFSMQKKLSKKMTKLTGTLTMEIYFIIHGPLKSTLQLICVLLLKTLCINLKLFDLLKHKLLNEKLGNWYYSANQAG